MTALCVRDRTQAWERGFPRSSLTPFFASSNFRLVPVMLQMTRSRLVMCAATGLMRRAARGCHRAVAVHPDMCDAAADCGLLEPS